MEITVIFVEPEYGMNVGYVCRVMANFGRRDLVLVNPQCEIGFDAVKYSKHGKGILRKARVVDSFEKEIKKYGLVVGTTGIRARNRDAIRDVTPLGKLSERMGAHKGEKVALVIGREGIGLRAGEINKCDILVTIEADKKYPVLNVSHALAVLLYELSGKKFRGTERMASPGERKKLMEIWEKLSKKSKDPEKAEASFRRIIGRAGLKRMEAIMLIEVLKDLP